MKASVVFVLVMILLSGFFTAHADEQEQQEEELPSYLKDRVQEIPTSMFGTYINRGELLFYPF